MQVIDIHAHIYQQVAGITQGQPMRSTSLGRVAIGDRQVQFLPPSFEQTRSTAEMLLAYMDWCGIEKALLMPNPYYGYHSQYLKDSVRRYPDRLKGVALVDIMKGQKAAEDKLAAIEDKLKEQEEKKNAAQEYEAQAMIAMQNGDMQGAKSQYMLARTVYQESGSNEDMQRVQNTLSDMGSGEESWREENSRKNEESSSSVSGNG